jgi:two-component system cell cycle sensor histidine kinase/response regulator CckA
VAHDFNNLLSVIIGNADLALMDIDEGHLLYARITGIKEAGHKAASLTRQLLAFSRKEVIHPEILNINGVVKGMEKMLRRIIGEDIHLRTVLAPDLWSAKLDPGQVDQILMNLSVNARDAMPRGGSLTLGTANTELDAAYFSARAIDGHSGPYVMLAVSDTGTGMDKKTQARIFDPFFTTKEMGRGTGLGLSTVYGIVKQNHGHIWVYSEPGQGTTFKVYFPMSSEEAALERKKRKEAPTKGAETVLVVEDDKMVRGLIENSLQRHGYTVLKATNGEEARELARTHEGPIHLMLSDVVMPGMTARELVEGVEALRPGIRVIYMSGYTDDAISSHGILPEEMNFMQKPISPEGLCRKVREVLDGE